jgi:hypothetical protein
VEPPFCMTSKATSNAFSTGCITFSSLNSN